MSGTSRESIMGVTLGIEIAGEFLIGRLRYDTLLVEEGEDARVLFVY